MEFDKCKVYHTLNADRLKIGSKVIVADNLKDLKDRVIHNVTTQTLRNIKPEDEAYRFSTDSSAYVLAYLIEAPAKLKWTDLKVGDIICNDTLKSIVIAIDERHDTRLHVLVCDKGFPTLNWIGDDDLKKWEKVEK